MLKTKFFTFVTLKINSLPLPQLHLTPNTHNSAILDTLQNHYYIVNTFYKIQTQFSSYKYGLCNYTDVEQDPVYTTGKLHDFEQVLKLRYSFLISKLRVMLVLPLCFVKIKKISLAQVVQLF